MGTRSGKLNNMSFFIHECKEGFKAEFKVGRDIKEKVCSTFNEAVEWVEEQQRNENKELENQRDKEST